MPSTSPEDYNPFEAPAATIAGATPVDLAGTDVELYRRRYLKHEASVRSVGTLAYLGSFLAGLVFAACSVALVAMIASAETPHKFPVDPRSLFGGIVAVALIAVVLYGALGYGLRRLQPWARWTSAALAGLYLLFIMGGFAWVATADPRLASYATGRSWLPIAIACMVLYLMLSAKGTVVFSADYREVVRQTPHIRSRTSLVVKVPSACWSGSSRWPSWEGS